MSIPRLAESDQFFGAVEVYRPDDARSETLWGSSLTQQTVFLQTNRAWPVGQRVGLAFQVMGERVCIRVAEVVSIRPFEPVCVDGTIPGMEVRFLQMDPPYRAALRRHTCPGPLSLVPSFENTGPVPTPPPIESLAIAPLSWPPAGSAHVMPPPHGDDVAGPRENAGTFGANLETGFNRTDTAPNHPLVGWSFQRTPSLSDAFDGPDSLGSPPLDTSDPWQISPASLPDDLSPGPLLLPSEPPYAAASDVVEIDITAPQGFRRPDFEPSPSTSETPDVEEAGDDERGEPGTVEDEIFEDEFCEHAESNDAADALSQGSDAIAEDGVEDDTQRDLCPHDGKSSYDGKHPYDGELSLFDTGSVRDNRRPGRSPLQQRLLGAAVVVVGASIGVVLGLSAGPERAGDTLPPLPNAATSVDATSVGATSVGAATTIRTVAEIEAELRAKPTNVPSKSARSKNVRSKNVQPTVAPPATKSAQRTKKSTPGAAAKIKTNTKLGQNSKVKRTRIAKAPVSASPLTGPTFSAGQAEFMLKQGRIVRTFGLANPGRVVVDLTGVGYPGFIRRDVRLDGIASYRIGRPNTEHVRVVIELDRAEKPKKIRAEKSGERLELSWR